MNKRMVVRLSVIANAVWVVLGVLTIGTMLGWVDSLLTWWMFGIGMILGGGLGIVLALQSNPE